MPRKPNDRSSRITAGDHRAPNRAMLRAVGFKDQDFTKPIIGVASTFSDITPCNMHIHDLALHAQKGAEKAGGKGLIFGAPTVSDGISMGTEGMKFSLVSREVIADSVPIIMAGRVWYLREWEGWIDNSELGQIAFQFGTRPLLTHESPIPQGWKDALRTLEPGDVLLHRFSPTGFYSSAVRNPFLRSLEARSERQIP